MNSKSLPLFLLSVACVNLAIAVARPDGGMTHINYFFAAFCFGAAVLTAIEGRK